MIKVKKIGLLAAMLAMLLVFNNAGTKGLAEDSGCNAKAAGKAAGESCGCANDPGCWRENLQLFIAGDAWKNHGDDDDNNNFGYRAGFNMGFGRNTRIRGQLGASYGVYDFHGREDPQQVPTERQIFLTGGIYKRSNVCADDRVSWGMVYDFMKTENWGEEADDIELGQFRFQVGYAVSSSTELGLWGALAVEDDLTVSLGGGIDVKARDQVNLYWRRNTELGAELMIYIGLAEEPTGINQVQLPTDMSEFVLGVAGNAPLSNRWALTGNVHYIIPSTAPGDNAPNGIENSYAEESWNVTLGLVFYPGGNAVANSISGWAGLPLMPVADNGTFSVNTPAGAL